MKTLEEIKKALRICSGDKPCWEDNGEDCPYFNDDNCQYDIERDALEIIENLEERIAIMMEGSESEAQ